MRNKTQALGQNFLVDTAAIHKLAVLIAATARESRFENILEIGPGKGALTFPVLEQLRDHSIKNFVFVEKDRNLFENLQQRVAEKSFIKGFNEDFLKTSFYDWAPKGPWLVFSNLPYSSGKRILLDLAQSSLVIDRMILMFQREVAKKIAASEGASERGSLSLAIQNHWEVQSLINLPPTAFKPSPKIWSEVLRFNRRSKPLLDFDHNSVEEKLWEELLDASFSQPRKMIRNNLKNYPAFTLALEKAGIPGTLRPHHLNWDQWKNLLRQTSLT